MMRIITTLLIIFSLLSGCQFIPAPLPTSTMEITGTELPIETATQISTVVIIETITPEATQTASPIPIPTATPTPLPIIVQPGSPAYIRNFAHTETNCNWLGLAGQVFDAFGAPVNNLVVNIRGKLAEAVIDKAVITGIPEANVYGPGGFEIQVANRAIASTNTLSIQVMDLDGKILSAPLPFSTYADCEKNLVIINFQMK